MKYFAKYLPVEGEIKEGETGISVNGAIYTHYNHLGKHYGKPAKLFLCSRDIKVGDEVQDKDGVKFIIEKHAHSLLDREDGHLRTKIFKVVGEISPEAVWVKEGDEFEEKDIRLLEADYSNSVIGGFDWKEVTINEYKRHDFLPYKLQIKCPTCKTFH